MEEINLKNGTKYRERIRINGKNLSSPLFSRKSDAKTWKNKKIIEKEVFKLHGEEANLYNNILFEQYAAEWIKQIQASDRSKKTISTYISNVNYHLIPFFKNKNINKITLKDVNQFNLKLREQGYKGKGRNNILGVMKTLFKGAMRDNYILKSPAGNLPKQKEELREDVYLEKKEISQFLLTNYLDSDYYPLYFTAIHTGMRLAELCGLCWDRIDFHRKQISVSRTRDKSGTRDMTKGGKKRIIPIIPELLELFLQLIRKQLNPRYVFSLQNGQEIPYGHVYRKFKKAREKANIPAITFHDLRHTFATQFMINGGNVFELQKIMGHSKIETTLRYAHFSEEHLMSATRYMSMKIVDEPILNQENKKEPEKLIFGER